MKVTGKKINIIIIFCYFQGPTGPEGDDGRPVNLILFCYNLGRVAF